MSVMYRIFRSKYERGLMFFIYRDGLALRSPLPSDAFVFKIKHNHEELIDVLIDEAQIVCLGMRYFSLGGQEITVFDFGS